MRNSLLLLCLLVAALTAAAKGNLKVKCINESDNRPVAFVNLTVEYPDGIVNYQTDRKGKVSFTPSSYPLTVAARAEGMYEAVVGLMSAPSGTLTIELAPDPTKPVTASRRRVDWSTDRPRRLSSTYIVRTHSSH